MVNKEYESFEEFKLDLEKQGMKALDRLYISYKEPFVNFCRKFNCLEEDINDVYQDAVIAFYEKVNSGKLTSLSSSIKTYLFSIGKFKIFTMLKKDSKVIHYENENFDPMAYNYKPFENNEGLKVKLEEGLGQIGERCREILVLCYYQGYTNEAIMHKYKYKNENVVRSHKSRCLKSLKEFLK